jgi:fluoride exporter
MTALMVILGGAIGAPLRYLTDRAVQSRHASEFPWGTWTVNVVGSFVLGVVAAASLSAGTPGWLLPLVGTGVCGALTTFSTFGYETVRLVERHESTTAALNVLASLAVGLAAVSLGWIVGGG